MCGMSVGLKGGIYRERDVSEWCDLTPKEWKNENGNGNERRICRGNWKSGGHKLDYRFGYSIFPTEINVVRRIVRWWCDGLNSSPSISRRRVDFFVTLLFPCP